MLWISDYVDVPYVKKGRTIVGLDCWGLVRLVLMEQFGVFLPSFDDTHDATPSDVATTVLIEKDTEHFLPVETPSPGDIVLMKFFNVPCHVGVFVLPFSVLHTDPMCVGTSRVERLSSPRLSPRIEGYYRVQ